MSLTKRQLIEMAFEEIGLVPSVFNLKPAQLQRALRRMDAMIAGWNTNGIRINYPLPTNAADADLDADSGIPDAAIEAVYASLAIRIAGGFGKTVRAETKQMADTGYNNLANLTAYPVPERPIPGTMPRGAGTKPWRNFTNPFVRPPEPQIEAGPDGTLEFD